EHARQARPERGRKRLRTEIVHHASQRVQIVADAVVALVPGDVSHGVDADERPGQPDLVMGASEEAADGVYAVALGDPGPRVFRLHRREAAGVLDGEASVVELDLVEPLERRLARQVDVVLPDLRSEGIDPAEAVAVGP